MTALTLSEARSILLRECNSFTRLPELIAMQYALGGEDWLRLLGEEWSCCDNIGEHADDLWDTPLADLLDTRGHDRDTLRRLVMSEAECEAFDALADQFEVWRGCYALNKWGLSWSLDRSIAAGFPQKHRYRRPEQALLVGARVAKNDVAFLKLDRGEAEVVVHKPRHISTSHLHWVLHDEGGPSALRLIDSTGALV